MKLNLHFFHQLNKNMGQNFAVLTYIDLGLSSITIPSFSATWIMSLTSVERSLSS
jgi:hypothetical protein